MKVGTFIPSISTHKGHILYKLLCGSTSNNKALFGELDTCNSASRICELRSDGWNISDRPLRGSKNPRSKEYFMKGSVIRAYLESQSVRDFIALYSRKYGTSTDNVI